MVALTSPHGRQIVPQVSVFSGAPGCGAQPRPSAVLSRPWGPVQPPPAGIGDHHHVTRPPVVQGGALPQGPLRQTVRRSTLHLVSSSLFKILFRLSDALLDYRNCYNHLDTAYLHNTPTLLKYVNVTVISKENMSIIYIDEVHIFKIHIHNKHVHVSNTKIQPLGTSKGCTYVVFTL